VQHFAQKQQIRNKIITGGTGYGWIPHNAGFGFLDIAGPTLGQNHFFDRF
jgi:hypothetical protein